MTDTAMTAVSFDGVNRLPSLAYTGKGGSVNVDASAFTLDNANRITEHASTVDGDVNFGYDVTNQVTSASYTGSGQPANEAYSYTKNGNRTNASYQTGTNNQLLSDGTFNYSYDGEGNRTVRTRISPDYASDYRTTYSWDYRNRLTGVEDFDNNGVLTKHVHYVYDTLDHEIGKQVDDTGAGSYDRGEWYVLDVTPPLPSGEGRGEGAVIADQPNGALADPLLQFDASGNLQFRYFSGPSPAGGDTVYTEEQIGTQGQAGTEYWPLGDNENTPHEVVNNASAVVDHIITNTFGVVTSESAPTVHHWSGFEGGHLDVDTAAVDDYFRWYDPATAKWLSEDPTGFTAGDADLSRYVGNGPTDHLDVLGLQYPSSYGPQGGQIPGPTPISHAPPLPVPPGTSQMPKGPNGAGPGATADQPPPPPSMRPLTLRERIAAWRMHRQEQRQARSYQRYLHRRGAEKQEAKRSMKQWEQKIKDAYITGGYSTQGGATGGGGVGGGPGQHGRGPAVP